MCHCISPQWFTSGDYTRDTLSLFLTQSQISLSFHKEKGFIVIKNSTAHMVWIGYFYYSQYGRFIEWQCSLWEKHPSPSLADTFTTRHRFSLKNFRGRNSFYYQEISCSANCWFVNSRIRKKHCHILFLLRIFSYFFLL